MGVQCMQSEGLFSQLLQVGNLLHIGQHEAFHSWKQYGEAVNSEGGYFKALLEGEEASIFSLNVHDKQLDTKPLSMRSLEINAAPHAANYPGNINKVAINANVSTSAIQLTNSANGAKSTPSRACLESKTSTIVRPLKRAREASQNEAVGKREKKGGREEGSKEKGLKKPEVQQAAAGGAGAAAPSTTALAGRKASSLKTKAPKPAPAVEPPKTDYVHVRARRGQATDSHSLAERVRREKISEKMRFLQDLVPGCSKITGKALILDEIINYVQSLQNQVEFLAMRLAATSPNTSLSNSNEEAIASPFVEEAVRDRIDMLPKTIPTHALSTSDLHFESLPEAFYPSLFDDSNFTSSIVSDLSTSTCNESDLTNMDFSHLG